MDDDNLTEQERIRLEEGLKRYYAPKSVPEHRIPREDFKGTEWRNTIPSSCIVDPVDKLLGERAARRRVLPRLKRSPRVVQMKDADGKVRDVQLLEHRRRWGCGA